MDKFSTQAKYLFFLRNMQLRNPRHKKKNMNLEIWLMLQAIKSRGMQ